MRRGATAFWQNEVKEWETHRNKQECFLHNCEQTIKYTAEEYILIMSLDSRTSADNFDLSEDSSWTRQYLILIFHKPKSDNLDVS